LVIKRKQRQVKPKPNYSGVLTNDDIIKRLEMPLKELRSLVITPLPVRKDKGPYKRDGFDRDSIDLRLGSHFFVPRSYRSPCFIPGLTSPHHLYQEQYIPRGSFLVLPAHNTVLGATLEYIKLPSDVSGEILTKSSWARTFITIETAPWVHPLFRGCLTLEIANVSNAPVILYPGEKIAQLILLLTTCDTSKKKEDEIEGTYIGPVRPEPAQLRHPEEALAPLGISKEEITYPGDEYLNHKDFQTHVADMLRAKGYTITKP
jgi:dCTP deaminase